MKNLFNDVNLNDAGGVSNMWVKEASKLEVSPDLPTYKVIMSKNLFSEVDLNDAAAAVKVWVKELEKTIKPEFKLEPAFINDVSDLDVNSLQSTALISMNSIDFLNYRSKLKLDGGFIPMKDDQIFCEYILLAQNNINSIYQLKGSKIGIESKYEHLIPYIWLSSLLDHNKLPSAENYFDEVKELDKESQLVHSVFFGQLNACIVSKSSFNVINELNPQIGKRLKILTESPGLVLTVTCFPKNFKNAEYRNSIIDAASNLNSYSGGKQILTLMNIDNVASFHEEYMDNVKKLLKDYKKIAAKNKKN